MKKEQRRRLSKIILTLLVVAVMVSPKLRAQMFVLFNAGRVEAYYTEEKELPKRLEEKASVYRGRHEMVEFALFSLSAPYSGCYYSPDDVPLAFQNVDVTLTQEGHDYWEWEDSGNHGATEKLRDCWYYYKAWL